MKIVYNDYVQQVSDNVSPADVFEALKKHFSELKNGDYTVVEEGGEKVLKAFLKTGNKA